MTTRRDFLKLAGLTSAAAALGVPLVAEAATKRTYTNFMAQAMAADRMWEQAHGRLFRNTYTGLAFGTGTVFDANGEKVDHVPLESVRKVADLMGDYFKRAYPHTDGLVKMPVYLNAREDTAPVAYITAVTVSERREVEMPGGNSIQAGPVRAELHAVIVSRRTDLDSGGWFLGPTLTYDDGHLGLTDGDTPPPQAVYSWGLFQGDMRWRSEPLRRDRRLIKAVGNVTHDTMTPSGAPIGKLIGKEATVVCHSPAFNSSLVVSVDGMIYDIHDQYLKRV